MLGNLPRAGGLALCRGGSRVDAGMHRFLVQQRGAAQRRRDPSAEANEDDGQFGWWPGLEGDAYRQRLKTFSVVASVGAAGYFLLNYENAEGKEHVFSGIQREYRRRVDFFFGLPPR